MSAVVIAFPTRQDREVEACVRYIMEKRGNPTYDAEQMAKLRAAAAILVDMQRAAGSHCGAAGLTVRAKAKREG